MVLAHASVRIVTGVAASTQPLQRGKHKHSTSPNYSQSSSAALETSALQWEHNHEATS